MAEDKEHADEQPDAGAEGHAVPTEDAQEIAGSAEDAALEAYEEAQEATVDVPPAEAPAAEATPAAETPSADSPSAEDREAAAQAAGHAVPGADAQQIAGSAEDAALEAYEEAEAADEEEAEPAPREKPAVPGAHLEVDIVLEGEDPLGREQEQYVDPYALEEAEVEAVETPAEEQPDEEEEVLTEPISTAAIDLASGARYRATGKRKSAIARVTLRPGSGTYLVNGRALEEHFPRLTLQRNIRQPLETVGYQERMDVIARLHGGGISAQAGALRHGVSRALLEADPNLRGELKRRGFLTRDSRAKERKKAGLKKARKRPQFSKR
jgi:small subunit ribosomal protein S9